MAGSSMMSLFDTFRKNPDLAVQWMGQRRAFSEIDRDVARSIIAEAVADEVTHAELNEIEAEIHNIHNVDWEKMKTIGDVIELLQWS
jgi:hypothetical protein